MLVHRAAVPPPRVAALAFELEDGVRLAAEEFTRRHPYGNELGTRVAGVLGQSDDEEGQTRRMAMTVIVNALVFHESLAEVEFKVPDAEAGSRRGVRPIESFRPGGVFAPGEVCLEWERILTVNYWPIFWSAKEMLRLMPTATANALLGWLWQTGQKLVAGGVTRSHDLMGIVFQSTKSLDTFDFLAIPSLNKPMVLELARCEYIDRNENVIAVGNSGTGKTHVALGLGLAACQRGLSVGFTTAAALVHELIEARDERRLLNMQKKLSRLELLMIDELGFVPLSKSGAELLFEVFSQRYERGSVLVTSNLPFDEWTEVFGSERLTGALLDRLTHRVHILEMNGESYRLKQSRKAKAAPVDGDVSTGAQL